MPAKFSPQLTLDIRLDPGASFDSYYAGANAQAVVAVAAEPLLYLYGGEGLGKSHLLQAACRQLAEAGEPVAYVPLSEVMALSPSALEGLEAMSLVAVDELERLAGQRDWQVELFHLFNRIRDRGGRLVVAAGCKPVELGLELPDLVSRLQWGLVLRLQELDDADKRAALALRAQLLGLELSAEVAQYLLAHYPRDMNWLVAALERLDKASLREQRRLTVPFIKQVLGAA